jgi:hypothetical protein
LLRINLHAGFPNLLKDFGLNYVYLLLAFNLAYFFGLHLATLNYRLNLWGRVIFWSLFGSITLSGFIGSMEVLLDDVPLDTLGIFTRLISKPLISLVYFANEGLGQLLLVCLILLVLFIALWAFLFQNMRIKYTKVDE